MPSAYLQWRFHSGERVVARGPLVFSSADVPLTVGIQCFPSDFFAFCLGNTCPPKIQF